MNVRVISKILLVILWLGTFAAALMSTFVKNPPFDPDPIAVLLGLISTAVTALVNEYSNRLTKEEFSTSYALAYGYVNNFLEPVLTQLLRQSGGSRPRLVIYLPHLLSELEPPSIERLIARMREMKLSSNTVSLELSQGKVRDILTVRKDEESFVYFDFPTTLLTLNSYIEYKLETRHDNFKEEAKAKLGTEYIGKFREALIKMIKRKHLDDYISFTDQNLTLSGL